MFIDKFSMTLWPFQKKAIMDQIDKLKPKIPAPFDRLEPKNIADIFNVGYPNSNRELRYN